MALKTSIAFFLLNFGWAQTPVTTVEKISGLYQNCLADVRLDEPEIFFIKAHEKCLKRVKNNFKEVANLEILHARSNTTGGNGSKITFSVKARDIPETRFEGFMNVNFICIEPPFIVHKNNEAAAADALKIATELKLKYSSENTCQVLNSKNKEALDTRYGFGFYKTENGCKRKCPAGTYMTMDPATPCRSCAEELPNAEDFGKEISPSVKLKYTLTNDFTNECTDHSRCTIDSIFSGMQPNGRALCLSYCFAGEKRDAEGHCVKDEQYCEKAIRRLTVEARWPSISGLPNRSVGKCSGDKVKNMAAAYKAAYENKVTSLASKCRQMIDEQYDHFAEQSDDDDEDEKPDNIHAPITARFSNFRLYLNHECGGRVSIQNDASYTLPMYESYEAWKDHLDLFTEP